MAVVFGIFDVSVTFNVKDKMTFVRL